MNLYNIKDKSEQVSFAQAVRQGLGREQGLFFPEVIAPLTDVDALLDYRARAPHAVRAHPTEEHFLPIFFALGAAGWGSDAAVAPNYLTREIMYRYLAMDAFALG